MPTEPDLPQPQRTTRRGLFGALHRRDEESLAAAQELWPDDLPSEGETIEPLLSDDELLADIEGAREEPGLHVWWLGQSGFLVQLEGEHLVLDPYLSDTLTAKYAGTDTPHERLTRRVIAPERLSFVDLVTSSHSHTDHLDPGTLPALLSGGARLVCAAGSEELARERSGHDPFAALAVGDDVEVGNYRIEAVSAYHEGAPEAVGYLVHNGPYVLYHAGDTRRVQGMAETVGLHVVDVAFLPVNGQRGNMNGADAARLAYEAGVRIAIPCHIGMFRDNTASPARFVAECARLGQEYRLLQAGEPLILDLW